MFINYTNLISRFFVSHPLKGYVAKNSINQQPNQIRSQTTLNCQPGIILPPAPYNPSSIQYQPQLVQQLSSGQLIQRPLSFSGGGVQTVMLQ
jgi:hypothetical protein